MDRISRLWCRLNLAREPSLLGKDTARLQHCPVPEDTLPERCATNKSPVNRDADTTPRHWYAHLQHLDDLMLG